MNPATRIKPHGKKLLALDGGGIRGAMTIEVLAAIEAMLREQWKRPDLVLADYFDYIGGTSTGAIIAAALAIGLDTGRLRTFYQESGQEMFDKSAWYKRFQHKYEGEALTRAPAPGGNQKLFTYLRYNAELTGKGLKRLGLENVPPERVRKLDSVEAIGELQQVGRAVAKSVHPAHYAAFLK